MTGKLAGKAALITGGSSGIGKAVARRFLDEGARVAVLSRDEDQLAAMTRELPDVVSILGDVRDSAAHREAVERTVSAFGALDILIPNAGIWDWNTKLLDLPEDPSPAFDEIFAINVKGYLLAAKAAARALAESSGTIIFTLSNAALYTDGGGPLYTASRHATLGLMRQLAFELAPRIRVNGVAVGGLKTDLRGAGSLGQQDMSIGFMPLEIAAPLVMPLMRQPAVEDVTGPYAFLADVRDSGTMTGAVIEAHGGVGIRGFFKPAGGYDLDPGGDPTAAARETMEAMMAMMAASKGD
jgi:cis-2,3-dihydrobiphenyl-2,3-diol dehydrogenase